MSNGEFFAVDRHAWIKACSLGLNPATVYLLLARGTGADQRTSSWSIHAVEKYTGLSRSRAQTALSGLVQAELVRVLKSGTRPGYYLTPAHELPITLNINERRVLEVLANGPKWIPKTASYASEWGQAKPHLTAGSLAKRGLIRDLGSQKFGLMPDDPDTNQPDWIWLPNALVTGVHGEVPPLERVRRLQDARVLRLLVSLYYDQNLPSDCGLHWRTIRRSFRREKIAEVGRWNIWQFNEENDAAWWQGPFVDFRTGENDQDRDVWQLWQLLRRAGLIECVPHLVEADTDQAEIIHPVGVNAGTEIEQKLGETAQEAALAFLNDRKLDMISSEDIVVPVPDEFPNVEMVGIYRLRYRARTKATGAWAARQAKWKDYIDGYLSLAQEAGSGKTTTFPTNLQHQGRSRGNQRT